MAGMAGEVKTSDLSVEVDEYLDYTSKHVQNPHNHCLETQRNLCQCELPEDVKSECPFFSSAEKKIKHSEALAQFDEIVFR